MTNKYKLSLTPDYCEDWTVVNAVRELLQNALDNQETFEYSFADNKLEIKSLNTTIPPKSLLLGNTTKRCEADSVGGYGEGYKIAALVLLREGHKLVIQNGSRTWTPVIEYDNLYDTDILVFEEELGGDSEDLTFTVYDIDSYQEVLIRDSCLYLQKDLGEAIEGNGCTVYLEDPAVSKLFVGGLYVCDIPKFKYTYDFGPAMVTLNRDRKTVEDFELTWETSRVLTKNLSGSAVAELLKAGWPDIKVAEHHGLDKNSCFRLFKEENSGKVAVMTEEQKASKVEIGYKPSDVKVIGETRFAKAVIESDEYKESLEGIPCEEPEEEESLEDLLHDFEVTNGPFSYEMKKEYDIICERVWEVLNG